MIRSGMGYREEHTQGETWMLRMYKVESRGEYFEEHKGFENKAKNWRVKPWS